MSTDKENQKKQSEQTENKNKKVDTSNSLENDAVGEFGSNNPTPQARTDQEQDQEQNKQK